MIEKLTTLPLYQSINISLLLGSMLLCIILWLAGVAVQALSRSELPRIPRFSGSVFPHPLEELYTQLFIVFFALLSLSNIFSDQPTEEYSALDAWVTAIIVGMIYVPMALRYMALPICHDKRKLHHLGITVLALVVIYLFNFTLNACGSLDWLCEVTGSPERQQLIDDMVSFDSPGTLAALCFSSIIIAPVMEEFAFRGFIYNVLRQRVGIIAASLSSSLFFAAVHTSLAQTPVLFIFGCAQCWLYEKTQSLRYPILLHMVFNTISTVAVFVFAK